MYIYIQCYCCFVINAFAHMYYIYIYIELFNFFYMHTLNHTGSKRSDCTEKKLCDRQIHSIIHARFAVLQGSMSLMACDTRWIVLKEQVQELQAAILVLQIFNENPIHDQPSSPRIHRKFDS